MESYCREQGFFFVPDSREPEYSVTYDISLDTVVPSLAGPKRPQDLLPLAGVREDFFKQFAQQLPPDTPAIEAGTLNGCSCGVKSPATHPCSSICATLTNGSVVIAAITSCTNTSNPDVMIGAGLLARKALGPAA